MLLILHTLVHLLLLHLHALADGGEVLAHHGMGKVEQHPEYEGVDPRHGHLASVGRDAQQDARGQEKEQDGGKHGRNNTLHLDDV